MCNNEKENILSRRDFIRNTGAVGVGSVLTAAGILGCKSDTPETKEPQKVPTVPKAPEEPKEPRLPTRSFGRTGVKVSMLALGGIFDTINNQLLLRQALKWGLRYWDTANSYGGGKSELGYGKFFGSNPEARKEIFLVTKGGARDSAGLTRMLDLSLERMQTDYIDLYFIHGLRNGSELLQHADEFKAWVEKAKAAKKIRFFGFSTHSNMPDCLQAAAKLGWINGIMLTYNYRLMFSEKMKAAIDACTKAGIGLTAMKTQAKGFSEFAEQEQELLDRFLAKGFNDAQARIKAVWTNPSIASLCSQMPNMNILMSNIAAAMDKTKLSDTELKLMEQNAKETSASYCAGCSDICQGAIAGDVPICDVLRYAMYHNSYGDRDRAKRLFADLPVHVRARLKNLDYSLAEKKCPQGIAIGAVMRQAVRILT